MRKSIVSMRHHMRENLTRRFGALTAVDHLNLEIAEGEIFGAGGSGRSG